MILLLIDTALMHASRIGDATIANLLLSVKDENGNLVVNVNEKNDFECILIINND